MSKKIVVITGSPRKKGNSFAMTDAFIEAAKAKGHTVTRFDAAMMKLSGCHACETCYKTGKACSFDDDFNLIAPAILEADALVFTMPVYWYSIPSQIKSVIDRIYSLVVGGKDIAGKECALIACCEEDDLSVLDGVRIPMERTAALNNMEDGRRGADSRGPECRRHRKNRRLQAGGGAGGQNLIGKGESYGKKDCNTERQPPQEGEHFCSCEGFCRGRGKRGQYRHGIFP